ncbi:MAG: YjjG family noncanonical pyrimidine nucleotidase [Firmicutes bacterium]|nr:YjjG family noncanonical pyrimidine nucleotidase [Bacillota bacterium]
MRYETLLFDADNTVLDFDKAEEQALRRVFEKFSLRYDAEALNIYRKNNVYQWQLFEQGKIEKSAVLINRFSTTLRDLKIDVAVEKVAVLFEDYLKQGYYVIENAESVLLRLQKTCRLYIVSNGVAKIQSSRMKGSGMDKYFLYRFVSEEVGYPKPSKEYFEYCFKRIPDFNKSTTLIIGDSLSSDIQGGINAQIDTCWYNPKRLGNNTGVKPTYEITDLRELFDIV